MKNKRVDLACENCKVQEFTRFKSLDSDELDSMTYNKTCTAYKKGQVLFHEGTRPLGVFCLHAGKIKIYKTGYDGKDQIIQISKPGDLIGYKAMISEEMYPVSAETLEDATVCFIPKSDFLSVLDSSSQLNRILLKEACQELGVMTESLTNLAQKPVRERLAVTLIMLKDTYGIDAAENGEVEINLTREDLANTVGTATETLIRLLHDFKEEKLIESKGRKIKVLDDRGLFKVANIY